MARASFLEINPTSPTIIPANKEKTNITANLDALDVCSDDGRIVNDGGKVPSLFTRQYGGLIAQYWIVGIIYGIGLSNYTIFGLIFDSSSSLINAAGQLVIMWFSFKIFFGIFIDYMPIMGRHRKPYILLGHGGALVLMCVTSSIANDIDQTVVMWLLNLCNFFLVLGDVAADSLITQMAQREPVLLRGKTQTYAYLIRQVGMTVGLMTFAFAFDCPAYGGQDFARCFSLTGTLWLLTSLCLVTYPCLYFFITDKFEEPERPPFRQYMAEVWETWNRREIYQIIAWTMINNLFMGLNNNAVNDMRRFYLGLDSLQSGLMSTFELVFMGVSLWVMAVWFVNANWRYVILYASVFQVFFQTVALLFVWDVTREPWFYIFTDVSSQFAYGFSFIVGSYCIVEICSQGKEAQTYALITTCGNVMQPFAVLISMNLMTPFHLQTDDIKVDDRNVHLNYTYYQLLISGLSLLSLCFLHLLPPQKKQCRQLQNKPANKYVAWFTIFVAIFGFCWTTMGLILKTTPGTQCLAIVGGC